MSIHIPYGKGHIDCAIPHDGLLTSRIDTLKSDRPGIEIVREAVASPIGSKALAELAVGKKTCTIIISDHTRPVPSRDILPPMLEELRKGNPDIAVTLLVATGFTAPPPPPSWRQSWARRLLPGRRSLFMTPSTPIPTFRSAFCPPARPWSSTGSPWRPTC